MFKTTLATTESWPFARTVTDVIVRPSTFVNRWAQEPELHSRVPQRLGLLGPGLGFYLSFPRSFQNSSNHLGAHFNCFWKARFKVLLDSLKLFFVTFHIAQNHPLAPVLLHVSIAGMLYTRLEVKSLTRAAKVNSKSSARNVLSSIAVSIASSKRSGLRKRYSAAPSHIRKS